MLVRISLFFLLITTLIGHALSKCCCTEDESIQNKDKVTREPQKPDSRKTQSSSDTEDFSGPRVYNTREEYLKGHNYYRRLIRDGRKTSQPRAIYLPDLVISVWNNTLERKAYEMSLTCSFEHQDSGINLYAGTSLSLDPLMIWFDEQKKYPYEPISSSNLEMYGHYTQMVWAETTSVGCWRNQCGYFPIPSGSPMYNAYYTVCKYYPPGNYENELPYKRV
ncbi:hypothetical protein D915_006126 [Fasciola hepatica]|uniref:SCP domain-containing protein n=1 Tax=Fasciola hepatica TaxID=6192 RepID=A0A4E0R3X3_FASHE|nr:hypothetical protein D915_006126 [Fasciola hepatica]